MTSLMESTRSYELIQITSPGRCVTFELRLLGMPHCARRKLTVLKRELEQQQLRRFGIKEIYFPNRDTYRLVFVTRAQLNSKYDTTSVRDKLYEILDGLLPTIIGDVDQFMAAKDDFVPAVITRTTRTTAHGRRHDKKQKRKELNRRRRDREQFRMKRTAAVQAFADAGLQPVVI